MIPRDKMKNITCCNANEGVGLTYTGAIRVDKASETHELQLHMRSAYDRRGGADDRKFKAVQESFDS